MSTYLVAFVVGPLEATEPVDVDGMPLRVVHTPGPRPPRATFALEAGAFALRYFTDYYGIPYPGDKLDLVAIPDFAFGAMENLGCVTFRETLLLVDPEAVTQPELAARRRRHHPRARAHVVRRPRHDALVERHLAERGVRHVHGDEVHRRVPAPSGSAGPTSGSRDRRPSTSTRSRTTRPIEYEVRSPADAEGMFDLLTYEKGAAVVRMLEQYLGEDRFREGIRRYLTDPRLREHRDPRPLGRARSGHR